MTPFGKATQLLGQIVAAAAAEDPVLVLPERRYSLVAEPVVDCESVIIALTGINQPEEFDANCGIPQIGSFAIIIARDCAGVADQNGVTIIERAEEVATQQARDGDFLWSFANSYREFVSKSWSVGFSITGDLSITTMLLTTGID